MKNNIKAITDSIAYNLRRSNMYLEFADTVTTLMSQNLGDKQVLQEDCDFYIRSAKMHSDLVKNGRSELKRECFLLKIINPTQ